MKWLRYTTIPIGIFVLVLSLIAPKVQASNSNYTFNLITDGTSVEKDGSITNNGNFNSSVQIPIINNSIITNSYIGIITYYNNGSYIGHTADNLVTVSWWATSNSQGGLNSVFLGHHTQGVQNIPNNATHFAITNIDINAGSTYGTVLTRTQLQNTLVSYNNPTPTTTDINNITWLENTKVDIANGTVTTNSAYRSTELIDVSSYTNLKLRDNQISATYTWTWLSVYDSNYNYVGIVHSSNASSQDNLWSTATFLQSSHRVDPNVVFDLTNYDYIRINQYVNNTDTDLWPNIDPTMAIAYGNDISIDTNIGLYTITFNDHLNQQIAQYTVVENANLYNLKSNVEANLTPREGFYFSGWDPDLNVATANATLTAQWEELIYYTVTFLDYDDTFIASGTVLRGEQATLPPTPLREHYVFSHWEPPVADVQGNITTYAQYDPATYQVTWRDQQGNTLKIETVLYSGLATAPEYTPSEGFVVNGWLDNDLPLPQIPLESPIQIDGNKIFVVSLTTAPPINPNLPPDDYSPISDLFGGVIGSSIGAIMTLGTITLFGIQLSALIYLFISATLLFKIAKAVRG